MAEWTFRLNLAGVDLEDDRQLDRLYEAGCDDATFATDESGTYATFHREASSPETAVLSAISNVDRAGDLIRVVKVETEDDWLTAAEIAQRTNRSRQNISQLVHGKRGPEDFPAPVSRRNARNPLWSWDEVRVWFAVYEPGSVEADPEAPSPDFLAVVNDRLDLRERFRRSPDALWWSDIDEVLPLVS